MVRGREYFRVNCMCKSPCGAKGTFSAAVSTQDSQYVFLDVKELALVGGRPSFFSFILSFICHQKLYLTFVKWFICNRCIYKDLVLHNIKFLWGRSYYCHFTHEESEAQKLLVQLVIFYYILSYPIFKTFCRLERTFLSTVTPWCSPENFWNFWHLAAVDTSRDSVGPMLSSTRRAWAWSLERTTGHHCSCDICGCYFTHIWYWI